MGDANFGNELVVQLELENSRLKSREEELRQHLQERIEAQQRRREELIAMI